MGERKKHHRLFLWIYSAALVALAVIGTAYCFDLKGKTDRSAAGAYYETGNSDDANADLLTENGEENDEMVGNGETIDDKDENVPLADPKKP